MSFQFRDRLSRSAPLTFLADIALGLIMLSVPTFSVAATTPPAFLPDASTNPNTRSDGTSASSWIEGALELSGAKPTFLIATKQGINAQPVSGSGAKHLISGTYEEILSDPVLDLLWLRSKGRLQVVDLRTPVPKPRVIAHGLPEMVHMQIVTEWESDKRFIQTPTTCDLGSMIQLNWQKESTLDVIAESGEKGTLAGFGWLADHVGRASNAEPAHNSIWLSATKIGIRLPAKLRRCEDKEECGRVVRFGKLGWQLVLVASHMGADCRHDSCLLYDSKKGTFASPLEPQTWVSVDRAKPSSCGPFEFDESEAWYLTGESLCQISGVCEQLDGQSIGWLRPGAWVGND